METLNFSIKARDYDRVFIEEYSSQSAEYSNECVWLSLATRNGSMFTVLSKEQAQELIAALQQVIA